MDERLGPVCQALAVQAQEGFTHGPRGDLVHGEAEARHVERGADAALLAQDRLARLANELPHRLEVLLAAERLARFALPGEDLVQDVLRGDRSVIEAGQEERRPALHSGVPGHQVFDGRALGVAKVQRAGDVRRRLDDHEGLLAPVRARALAVGIEDVGVDPALVDGMFDFAGSVGLRHFPFFSRATLAGHPWLPRLRPVHHRSLRQ